VAIHLLQTASKDALVDYFICEVCGHVWTVPKGKNWPVRHITDPRPPFAKPKSA
jgi:hypothetical protein